MKVLITGGLGVNGAVTARLMTQDGLRPVLMDNRMDLTLMGDIKDQVDIVIGTHALLGKAIKFRDLGLLIVGAIPNYDPCKRAAPVLESLPIEPIQKIAPMRITQFAFFPTLLTAVRTNEDRVIMIRR